MALTSYNRCGDKTKVSIKIITAAFKNDNDILRFQEIFEPISHYRYIQRILKDMWSDFDDVIVTEGGSTHITVENRVSETCSICSMPLTMMTIHSNGYVGVCPMDWKFGTMYGDVNSESLVQMWNSDKLKQFRIKHLTGKRKDLDYCKGCQCVGDDQIDGVAEMILERINV